jgi:hypothetical protein
MCNDQCWQVWWPLSVDKWGDQSVKSVVNTEYWQVWWPLSVDKWGDQSVTSVVNTEYWQVWWTQNIDKCGDYTYSSTKFGLRKRVGKLFQIEKTTYFLSIAPLFLYNYIYIFEFVLILNIHDKTRDIFNTTMMMVIPTNPASGKYNFIYQIITEWKIYSDVMFIDRSKRILQARSCFTLIIEYSYLRCSVYWQE